MNNKRVLQPRTVGKPRQLFKMMWGKTAFEQSLTHPLSGESFKFVLFHCKNVGHVVFPLTDEGFVVATKQFKYSLACISKDRKGKSSWIIELPAGCARVGERGTQVARRELLEETGYRARRIERLSTKIWNDPSISTLFSIPWFASGCRFEGVQKLDSTEFIRTELIPLHVWFDMIYSGKIVDTRSIAVSTLAVPYLRKKMGIRF